MKLLISLIIPLPLVAGGGTLNRDNGLMLFLFILSVLVLFAGVNMAIENRIKILHFFKSLFHFNKKNHAAPEE